MRNWGSKRRNAIQAKAPGPHVTGVEVGGGAEKKGPTLGFPPTVSLLFQASALPARSAAPTAIASPPRGGQYYSLHCISMGTKAQKDQGTWPTLSNLQIKKALVAFIFKGLNPMHISGAN